jgi:hypothetical protein
MSATDPTDSRLRALLELSIPDAREGTGRHEYDGRIQDLSPTGVKTGLTQLGGPEVGDPHDEAHLQVFEESARVRLGELELHRRNPLVHLENLDLSCYDRDYAPEGERLLARRRHLALWPDAVAMACESLDLVPAPVATALLPGIRGLADGIEDQPGAPEARAAHKRLVAHIEERGRSGTPDTALGRSALERLMGVDEGVADVDLTALSERAERERDRLTALMDEGRERWAPGVPSGEVVQTLLADHPAADGVLDAARTATAETIEFCRERGWLTHLDGVCRVGVAPPSRRWATAMLAWAGPYEEDAPSHYDITPPDPEWPQHEQDEWLTMFSETALPAVTAHEVAPGHFAHGRALRRAPSDVRRSLMSAGFAEGWAHYGEELMLEEGFRAGDPRFQIGVALEALVRVTRLTCAIGLHTGAMDVDDATAVFVNDALMPEATARSEARRGTFDPTYGIYTWGKWTIQDAREDARQQWGHGFSLRRFHDALMELGSPPLGLVGEAVRAG